MHIKIESIYDLLSLISLFCYIYYFYSMDIVLIVGAILCLLLHNIIKHVTQGWYPPIFKRPDGATDCNLFNSGGLVDEKSGFPSGHVTAISFLMNSLLFNTDLSYQNIILYNIPILLVAYARVMKGCHNIIQVIAGYILGISVSHILHKYKSQIKKYITIY